MRKNTNSNSNSDQNQSKYLHPNQNAIPNKSPNQLLHEPLNLQYPMTQQLNQFYHTDSNINLPTPSNNNPVLPDYGNFKNAFNPMPSIPFNGIQPKAMFSNHGFVNRNDLLHNNLYDIILHEEIREYSILIDSKDRNYQVYPNPFKYKVTFNPLPTTREKVNGKTIKFEIPNPVIYEEMTNVRYIVLEDIILPFFNKVRKVNEKIDGRIVPALKVNTTDSLTDFLYIVLGIGEYTDVNCRSTNDVLSDSFATIYFDSRTSNTHYAGYTRNGIKIFDPDELGTIKSFSIKFMDPYGKELDIRHLDKRILSNLECTCGDDPEAETNPDCFRHNLSHPLNPIFQHHLHFRVGILKPRLNKRTFS